MFPTDGNIQNQNWYASTEVIDHHYCNIDPRQLTLSGDSQYCPADRYDRCNKIKEKIRLQQLAYIDVCILLALGLN